MNNWDDLVSKVAEMVTQHEHYQRVLGQIAFEIASEYGKEALNDFAEEVKETHGLHISPATLKNYEYVYRNIKDLSLPEDLSYRTLQYIASSEQPTLWADKINGEGLSSAEAYRLLREEKGLNKKVRIIVCPSCNREIKL